MKILIFANLKEKKLLQQVMDWSKVSHIKFQMMFNNEEKYIKQMLYNSPNTFIVVLNEPKTGRILKKLNKRFVTVKNDWYKEKPHEGW